MINTLLAQFSTSHCSTSDVTFRQSKTFESLYHLRLKNNDNSGNTDQVAIVIDLENDGSSFGEIDIVRVTNGVTVEKNIKLTKEDNERYSNDVEVLKAKATSTTDRKYTTHYNF